MCEVAQGCYSASRDPKTYGLLSANVHFSRGNELLRAFGLWPVRRSTCIFIARRNPEHGTPAAHDLVDADIRLTSINANFISLSPACGLRACASHRARAGSFPPARE